MLCAASLQADPVTVVETLDPRLLSNVLTYSYDLSTFPDPIRANISGSFLSCYLPGTTTPCGLDGSIDLTIDLYTTGPIRPGIAELALELENFGGNVSGGVGPYGFGLCPSDLSCALVGNFPFELGAPFTIHLSGFGNTDILGSSFTVVAQLQLFEVPSNPGDRVGAPVEIELVPEPASASLAFTGLLGLLLFNITRRGKLPQRKFF